MKIYFAHPMASYGSEREERALEFLKNHFFFDMIINPNEEMHQKVHEIVGFKYFPLLVSSCDTLVAIPHKDGRFGNGTYQEILVAVDNGMDIYTLSFGEEVKLHVLNFKEIAPLSIEETKLYRKTMRG